MHWDPWSAYGTEYLLNKRAKAQKLFAKIGRLDTYVYAKNQRKISDSRAKQAPITFNMWAIERTAQRDYRINRTYRAMSRKLENARDNMRDHAVTNLDILTQQQLAVLVGHVNRFRKIQAGDTLVSWAHTVPWDYDNDFFLMDTVLLQLADLGWLERVPSTPTIWDCGGYKYTQKLIDFARTNAYFVVGMKRR